MPHFATIDSPHFQPMNSNLKGAEDRQATDEFVWQLEDDDSEPGDLPPFEPSEPSQQRSQDGIVGADGYAYEPDKSDWEPDDLPPHEPVDPA